MYLFLTFYLTSNTLLVVLGNVRSYSFTIESAVQSLRNNNANAPITWPMLSVHARKKRSDCECGEGSISCFDYAGRIACECENNRYVIGGSCSDCKCHNGLCDIEFGTCECWKGYGLVKGGNVLEHTCDKCNCGDEHIPCRYTDGMRFCYCFGGFVSVNVTCTECVCSENATCSFINGTKTCTCVDGFEENNDTCERCFCGDDHSCTFKNGSPVCVCKEDYAEHNGTCKNCTCSKEERCEFVDGQMTCVSKKMPDVPFDDSCSDCISADGFFSSEGSGSRDDCLHEVIDGKKICLCPENYADNGGTCQECSCGEDSHCLFENGKKVCFCKDGRVWKYGKCQESCDPDLCYRGTCEKDGDGDISYCKCDEGFTGHYCDEEIILTKGIILLISSLTAITLFWIILVARYIIRRRNRKVKYSRENFCSRENDIVLTNLR